MASHEDNLVGAIEIATPSEYPDLDLHYAVGADARLSWAPAHLSVVFLHNGDRDKISFRPHLRHSAVWGEVENQPRVFDEDARRDFPLMFNIRSEAHPGYTAAPQGRNSTEARKSDARNSRATNHSPANEWKGWPSDGWGKYSEGDWAVWYPQIEETKEMEEGKKDRARRISEQQTREEIPVTNSPNGTSPEVDTMPSDVTGSKSPHPCKATPKSHAKAVAESKKIPHTHTH